MIESVLQYGILVWDGAFPSLLLNKLILKLALEHSLSYQTNVSFK